MVQTAAATALDQALWDALAAGLESAWNAGNGDAFAAFFTEDADFVNIFGHRGKGRPAIAEAHKMIFRTVYAGSLMKCTVTHSRLLSDEVALIHLKSCVQVPQGPMAGEIHAVPSAVLVCGRDRWKIAAFHNTMIKEPPSAHNNGRPQ
jgi:uncharacterized protein (TIGR02246 family)